MVYGTLTRFDTLATAYNTTVAKFGEDLAWQAIQDALDAHNQQLNEAMGEFVESSTDRLRRYGGPDSMAMDELDEFATPDAQKISAGVTVAFPLKMYGIALQWTRLYFQNAMASEIAAQTVAAQDADIKAIHRELKKALFFTSNYTFLDRRVDGISLGVKALVNADGAAIPIAPDGTTFNGATHTHYLSAVASWSGATGLQMQRNELYAVSRCPFDTGYNLKPGSRTVRHDERDEPRHWYRWSGGSVGETLDTSRLCPLPACRARRKRSGTTDTRRRRRQPGYPL